MHFKSVFSSALVLSCLTTSIWAQTTPSVCSTNWDQYLDTDDEGNTSFWIGGCRFASPDDLHSWGNWLQTHPEISILVTDEVPLGRDGAAIVAQMPNLKELALFTAGLDDQAAQTLAQQLGQTKSIEGLYLADNQIGADGAKALALAFPNLTGLDLSSNPIGNHAIWFLSYHLPALNSLFLDNVSIRSSAVLALSNHAPISWLSLANDGLTDKDAMVLGSGSLLAPAEISRGLILANNQLTQEGFSYLHAQQSAQETAFPGYALFIDVSDNPGCSSDDSNCYSSLSDDEMNVDDSNDTMDGDDVFLRFKSDDGHMGSVKSKSGNGGKNLGHFKTAPKMLAKKRLADLFPKQWADFRSKAN